MRCLGSHLGHVVDKVYHTFAVTPLIVIPGHQLHTGQPVGSSYLRHSRSQVANLAVLHMQYRVQCTNRSGRKDLCL